jgi:hypothetical protein
MPSTAEVAVFDSGENRRSRHITFAAAYVPDTMLPHEYPSLSMARGYDEQFVLAALLLGSSGGQPLLPIYWLPQRGRVAPGSSFRTGRSDR